MTTDSNLPLDQLHADGLSCPMCGGGTLRRDGSMDGTMYHDSCSRPWYVCDACGEEMDGQQAHQMAEDLAEWEAEEDEWEADPYS